MLDLTKFKALTFDCYGTLIDWESGILETLSPFRAEAQRKPTDEEILEFYAQAESKEQAGGYKPYRDVLANVMKAVASYLGIEIDEHETGLLSRSIAYWKPFPDTVESLERLARRYRLVIVSNIDDDLFRFSAAHLQVPFDDVVTAEQVGAYKPSHKNFHTAIERIGLPKEEILHVAQSLFHDIKPANELGIANVWVNRRRGREGFGATHPADATPTMEVPDLATLADRTDVAYRNL
jgi:2-haloacid dehalogenase